jgi:hypothetical protein
VWSSKLCWNNTVLMVHGAADFRARQQALLE